MDHGLAAHAKLITGPKWVESGTTVLACASYMNAIMSSVNVISSSAMQIYSKPFTVCDANHTLTVTVGKGISITNLVLTSKH